MYYKTDSEITMDYKMFEKISVEGSTTYVKLRQSIEMPSYWAQITEVEFIEHEEKMLTVIPPE